ncbi:MAG: polyphosphate polymerase domain-containing protein [Planctomycetes bacterium]|nr:polyphosphate polymerase domain-containing protein [Planctomycetota bacterium]
MTVKGRYELKFPIDRALVPEIVAAAKHGLVVDEHTTNAVYRVSSLYFDTADLLAYWEKVDGERVRKKFRLRYYSVSEGLRDNLVQGAFMEIKHRINNTVFKERLELSDEGASAILADPSELRHLERHLAPGGDPDRVTIETVLRAANQPGFHPVTVITYLREAWIGKVDPTLRLTFDSLCEAYLPEAFAQVGEPGGVAILDPTRTIMEVKFDDAIPRWIRDAVGRFGLALDRFSKYAAGVEALGLASHDV